MMKSKIEPLIESVKANFWFVPTLMVLGTMVMTAVTIWIDTFRFSALKEYLPLMYSTDVSAIRTLLSTIAASMITVTSIAFSITIVALTLASSQFGPRLMRNFMKDKTTQIILGMFVSNFLYCILVFFAISLAPPYEFKPGITVVWAISMTCISIGYLIHFIHHVSVSIQADTVIQDVYCELKQIINKLFPHDAMHLCKDSNVCIEELGADNYQTCTELRAEHSGYVQVIDTSKLLEHLCECDVQLQLFYGPGDYVIKGGILGTVFSRKAILDNKDDQHMMSDIRKHIALGSKRTPVQDPEFAVGQLVEIALRALSPGINDPFTAITCIDKLSSALCELSSRQFPSIQWKDKQECVRLHCKPLLFRDVASAGFDQIRQHAHDNTAVTIRLLEALQSIALRANNKEQYQFVYEQINMMIEQQKPREITSFDAKDINQRIQNVNLYLQRNAGI